MEIYISYLRVFKPTPEMGNYKRKQEIKKTHFRPRKRSRNKERRHAFDQEKRKKR